MPDTISLLCPTRKRPQNIHRLLESIYATADDLANLELVLYIDNDDNSYDAEVYKADIYIGCVRGPRVVMSELWNKCYEKATGDILMHLGDDIVFRTKGWDTIVRNAFKEYPDNIVFVFGNDGSQVHDGVFGTHGFIHRKWVETVGYFVPPYFSSDFNDTWLNDVAKMIGRHKWVDIYTEHMHPDLYKAEVDITHQERKLRHARDNVGVVYANKLNEREADAAKLRKVMR